MEINTLKKYNLFYTFSKNKYLYNIIIIGLSIKFTALFIRCFLPFGLPESWRQYDTMGVSLRYWQRWTFEQFPDNFTWLQKYLLPAILNSGDHFGIVPMEFPILNLITAPFFILGTEYGRSFAFLFIILLVFILTLINAQVWKGRKIFNIPCYPAFLLMPIFSLGVTWSGKFMPDMCSILLICIGIGISLQHKNRMFKTIIATFIISIGLLMKPTSIILFMLYLGSYHLFLSKNNKEIFQKILQPLSIILISTSITLIYYYKINPWITSFQDIHNVFYLTIQPIDKAITEMIQNSKLFFLFWVETGIFLGGIFIIVPLLILHSKRTKKYQIHYIWLCIYIQMIFILLLTGNQSYSHLYYFLGTLPFFCLIFMQAWRTTNNPWIKHFLSIGLLIPILEKASMDLKNYTEPHRKDTTYQECLELKKRNPNFPFNQGYIFSSQQEPFPQIGVCFGERQSSLKNEFGIFHNRPGEIPSQCNIIDTSKSYVLTKCINKQEIN